MCDMCKDEIAGCQGCGINICFDVEHGDDFIRPAHVTTFGDVYCDRCGSRMDEEDDYGPEMDFGDFDPYEIDNVRISEL